MIADAAVVGQRRLLRAAQVGDDDARAFGREPVGDRAADPLRRAGDDGDLAVERAHQRTGEKDVGTRMRFCCVWISGWIFARNAFHASSAWSFARRCLALGEVLVAPERRVRRERADVGRVRAEQVAEVALLELDALGLVELHELVQLAGDHVVVALLDDHAMPPDAQVLDLEPLLDPVLRALAADARLLDAAERHDLGGDEARVDAVDAVLERLRQPPDARVVARVVVRGEPVRRVVRVAHRLGLGREARDAGDGAERLLARHRRVGRDAGDHRRLEEETAEAFAAEQQLAAAVDRVADVALHLVDRRLLDQRADVRRPASSPLPTLSFEAASTSRETNSS